MDRAPIRKGTLVEFAKNENDVDPQKCWHARMYHSSRMRSSHHFEKYEGISGCKHVGEEVHRHGFPKIPTKNPKNRRNERQVKFPPVPGANKDLRPTLSTVQPTNHTGGQSNKKGRPMKSSLSMSYNEFQRLTQLQKPKRQYEKISYTKAVHFNNGIIGYAPASYPEEYYTPRTKLQPSDYDIYNNPHIQEQLRIQHEKAGGKDGDILPWLNPKHDDVAARLKRDSLVAATLGQDPPVADTLGQDARKGDVDQSNMFILDNDRLQERKADNQVKQNETNEGAVPRQEEVNDGGDDVGYQSAGADDPLEMDKHSDAASLGNRAQEIHNNVELSDGAQEGAETAEIDSQNVSNEATDGGLQNEAVEGSERQGIVVDGETDEALDERTLTSANAKTLGDDVGAEEMTQPQGEVVTNENYADEPPARAEDAVTDGAASNDFMEEAIDEAVEAALSAATQELDGDTGNGDGNGNDTQGDDNGDGNGDEAHVDGDDPGVDSGHISEQRRGAV